MSDPSATSPIAGGADWLAQALTGDAATIIAILAMASLGALMLTGRLPARRAAEVIVGCFVLFSARLIAGALLGNLRPIAPTSDLPVIASAPYVPTLPKPVPYDPYAGASVPHTDQGRPIVR